MHRSRHRFMLAGAGLLALALTLPTTAALGAPTAAKAPERSPDDVRVVGKRSVDVASDGVAITRKARKVGTAKLGARASESDVLEAYWTPKRMRKATPAAADPSLRKAERAFSAKMRRFEKKGLQPITNDGPVESVEGAASKQLTAPGRTVPGKASTVPSAYNPNAPYYTPTAYTQGKVFFTKPGEGNFVCSGTIINSEGKDTVWTAGHCVHGGSGGGWHYQLDLRARLRRRPGQPAPLRHLERRASCGARAPGPAARTSPRTWASRS